MFLKQAFVKGNEVWKYLIGLALIVLGIIVGQIPFMGAIAYQAITTDTPMPTTNEAALTFLNSNLTLMLMVLSFVGGILGLYIAIRLLHKQKLNWIISSRPQIDWKRILFAFTLWGSIVVITTIIGYYFKPEDYVVQFDFNVFIILVFIAFVFLPFQTSAEEFIFRGYLMQGFALIAKNKWVPLMLTSVLFGLLHYANPEVTKMGNIIMVYYIGTGIFLGVITLMDEGMELALGFHAANNIFGALLVTAEWSALKTNAVLKQVSEPTVGFDVFVPVIILFPIMLYIFAKKYQWTQWKDKLMGRINTNDDVLN